MSGTLQASVVKDSASATNNLALDASGNVTVGNNLTVTGTTTHTGTVGATTSSGAVTCQSTLAVTGAITGSSTIAAATGTLYPLVSGTAQASTSGTSIDFTSIPSWVKRITVMFNGVSTNGTSDTLIQLGAGSVETTGYSSYAARQGATSNVYYSSALGFTVAPSATAATTRYGTVVFTLVGSNTWIANGITTNPASANETSTVAGGKTTSGTLDRIRITTVNGTDTFDAGSINILYE